jgi:hypothetical protein
MQAKFWKNLFTGFRITPDSAARNALLASQTLDSIAKVRGRVRELTTKFPPPY